MIIHNHGNCILKYYTKYCETNINFLLILEFVIYIVNLRYNYYSAQDWAGFGGLYPM